jgi:hypothetical protein
MPFNARTSLTQFQFIELLEVFFKIQLLRSIFTSCHHLNSALTYFFHGMPLFIHLELKPTTIYPSIWIYIHFLKFLLSARCFLDVDVLINVTLIWWTFFYALSSFTSCGHTHVQIFQPFPVSGLNEQTSPTKTFWGGTFSTSPNVVCQFS